MNETIGKQKYECGPVARGAGEMHSKPYVCPSLRGTSHDLHQRLFFLGQLEFGKL